VNQWIILPDEYPGIQGVDSSAVKTDIADGCGSIRTTRFPETGTAAMV
jgi:hypothetical protein